jgi:cytoskeletal protein CcmA (bactofilin family)
MGNMFGNNDMKTSDKSAELNTILGRGSVFDGNIKVEHSLRVDGRLKGDIVTSDTLVIGKDGQVIGNAKVKNLVLGGKFSGTVQASGKVLLESNSTFQGEISTGKLVIDEGAIFEGKCSMQEGGVKPQPSPATSSGGEEKK